MSSNNQRTPFRNLSNVSNCLNEPAVLMTEMLPPQVPALSGEELINYRYRESNSFLGPLSPYNNNSMSWNAPPTSPWFSSQFSAPYSTSTPYMLSQALQSATSPNETLLNEMLMDSITVNVDDEVNDENNFPKTPASTPVEGETRKRKSNPTDHVPEVSLNPKLFFMSVILISQNMILRFQNFQISWL